MIKQEIINSLIIALNFIRSKQSNDGAWRDFKMDVGYSSSWVTAYTLICLDDAKQFMEENIINMAVNYLFSSMRTDGGWGYNEKVSVDSDSTAHCILALRLNGLKIPNFSINRLMKFEEEYSFFKTFDDKDDDHSWGAIHYEVSGIVNLALDDIDRLKYFARILSKIVEEYGYCPTFWWDGQIYSSYVCAWISAKLNNGGFSEKIIISYLLKQKNLENDLAISLTGLTAFYLNNNEILDEAIKLLLDRQKNDGSWDSSKMLKYVIPNCLNEWNASKISKGPLIKDNEAVFTTATAIRLLSLYLNKMGKI